MNKKTLFKLCIGLFLVSVCIYGTQLLLFRDPRNTLFYIFQDFAFLPLTILIATLLVGYVSDLQSKKERIERTRILSSYFFSIIGCHLREMLEKTLDEKHKVCWKEEVFEDIMTFLNEKQDAILIIVSNPHLLEHEKFIDLLWSVLHLDDELSYRNRQTLTMTDKKHLEIDAQRVYDNLMKNWGEYEAHIKREYPYFYKSAAYSKWNQEN